MANIFKQVEQTHVKSNTFDLSHDKKMSMQMGFLTPILTIDTFPGDSFKIRTSQLMRMAPMIAPIMHQINVYTHYFFVPNRILWDNWENFITGGEDGLDTSVFPTIPYDGGGSNGLPDYLGLPQNAANFPEDVQVSAIPFAAYHKIYNEYFRDQNLQTPIDTDLIDGPQTANSSTDLKQLKRRAWQHDYFTSALPFTQKGPEATIPLGTSAPISFDNAGKAGAVVHTEGLNAPLLSTWTLGNNAPASGKLKANDTVTPADWTNVSIDNSPSLFADLSTATASSINDLRRAFKLQEWLEKNARGGSRYTESILVHFGVKSSDGRLQRPEYLGGGRSPVQISEVLQNSESLSGVGSAEPTPQGNMAGHGISAGNQGSVTYHCEEHGYIIGLMSVMPKATYQQGMPKHFRKFDKFDYPWPSFANLGEQPIQNEEIYFNTELTTQQDTFGYTPRYAEYKFINPSVHGDFRNNLDIWHMGEKYDTQPALNETFIQCDPTTRIFAVEAPEEQKLYLHVFNSVKAKRKLPIFGTPSI